MYPHFVHDAIESADNYYKYVQKTQNSRVVVKVASLSPIAADLYRLTFGQRLKNPESAELCIKSHLVDPTLYSDPENHYIDKEYFSIVKVEDSGKAISISVKEELFEVFANVPPQSISFVSDLSFLIKNVEDWYLDFGHNICHPSKPSFPVEQIYKGKKDSKEQIKATHTAMTSSISYIWGAPGTGKTQIVLANCIMSYLLQENSDSQILILAPTNNALEQTLRSVINALRNLGENIDCLYRLGISSETFARQFGKICERLDHQARIEELSQEIQTLTKRQECSNKAKELQNEYNSFLALVKSHEELQTRQKELPLKTVELEGTVNCLKKELSEQSEALRQTELNKKQITTKECSVLFRIKKFFDPNGEAMLKELQTQKAILDDNAQGLKKKIAETEQELQIQKTYLHDARIESQQSLSKINTSKAKIEKKTKNALGHFSTIEEAKREFAQLIVDSKGDITEDLTAKIAEKESLLRREQENMAEDLQSKRVFAFTVDYFFAHYKNLSKVGLNSSRIAHIFLDEAAYCPLIKSGILYSVGVPVTLLGDHMQLTPICEAEENVTREIENKIFLWELSAIYLPQIFDKGAILEDIFERFLSIKEAKDITQIRYYSEKNIKTAVLTKTYRFGNELANILNAFVYRNGFCGNSEIKTQTTVLHGKHLPGEKELRTNFGEAEAIKAYIKDAKLTDYAVMTPYRAQRLHLQTVLTEVNPDSILTIHASQGREWDTVIISVVDANDRAKFLTDSRIPQGLHTLNTAISRARKNIVIVCDTEYWRSRNTTQLIGQLVNPCPLPSLSEDVPNKQTEAPPSSPPLEPLPPVPSRKRTPTKPKQINISWSQKNRELYKRGIEIGHLENAIEQKTHANFISKIEISQKNAQNIRVRVLAETSKNDFAYETTLQSCTCKSFQFPPQKIPAACKHMFALALRLKVVTPNGRLNDSITIPSKNVILLP